MAGLGGRAGGCRQALADAPEAQQQQQHTVIRVPEQRRCTRNAAESSGNAAAHRCALVRRRLRAPPRAGGQPGVLQTAGSRTAGGAAGP